ncbi:hypothetical protein GCM10011390_43960 [Aureimonas endophytica]|uniref:DNA-binding protein n=2 Tax=Aureimonas endophytica TaxID=2027858 RepID=A0A917EC13_9HYPH|nr:hypothetical protein GCM10011390_43960 [Aureimonas endophytica]
MASAKASLPDISKLPADALLTRAQMALLTGFSVISFKKWAREDRGPRIVYVEGRPRTTVRDFKAWIGGSSSQSAA